MAATDALSHLRVIDLTRVRAGPTCAKQFADWGADVIKVEAPATDGEDGFGPRQGSDFQNLHRNKRSLTLNLKDPRGVEVLKRLVRTADVLVENYRPDVKHRLGIDYETLAKENPGLIYASISGFGQDGPYRDRAGFDQIAQGMGGLMWVTGLPGQGPVRAGIPVADLTAGLYAALGVMIALQERSRSGKGQWVQSSLLSAMVAMMDFQAARWLVEGHVPGQAGNDHPTSIPTGVFPTSDGYVNVAAAGNVIWTRLCEALGEPSLATQARVRHRRAALGEPRRAQRAAGRAHPAPRLGRADRSAQQGGRALRPDLQDERGVRRSAGEAPRHGGAGAQARRRRAEPGRSGDPALAHAGAHAAHHGTRGRAQRRDPGLARLRRGRDREAARRQGDLRYR